jgi:hypothetical protein
MPDISPLVDIGAISVGAAIADALASVEAGLGLQAARLPARARTDRVIASWALMMISFE